MKAMISIYNVNKQKKNETDEHIIKENVKYIFFSCSLFQTATETLTRKQSISNDMKSFLRN